jgi:hypothetical protein
MHLLPEYKDDGERTEVPMEMAGLGSWFIVFTQRNNGKTAPAFAENFPSYKILKTLNGEWTVDFSNKDIGPPEPVVLDRLNDWTTWEDEKVKYYSGTAVYSTTFHMEPIPEGDLFINLGEVGVMAEIRVNGKKIGGTWISPFRLDLKNTLKSGVNNLEIDVVNVWKNRLIGDRMLSEKDRYTWLLLDDMEPGQALQSSGLLGPVSIEGISP